MNYNGESEVYMFKAIRKWLRTSPHVHLDQRRPETVQQLIELLDRFLDGKLQYELEWDDFISWKNKNPNIELIRERIAGTEPLFFSKSPADRAHAVELLIEERNRSAALIGRSPREELGSE